MYPPSPNKADGKGDIRAKSQMGNASKEGRDLRKTKPKKREYITGEFRFAFEKETNTIKIGDKRVHIDKEAICVSCKNEVLTEPYNELYLSLSGLEIYCSSCERKCAARAIQGDF